GVQTCAHGNSTVSVSTAGTVIGQDQEGATTVLSLLITNAASGLTTTDGHAITLFNEGGIIVGRYDSNGDNVINGNDKAAFAIAIEQNGKLDVVQYVSLHHGSADGPGAGDVDISEPLSLSGKENTSEPESKSNVVSPHAPEKRNGTVMFIACTR